MNEKRARLLLREARLALKGAEMSVAKGEGKNFAVLLNTTIENYNGIVTDQKLQGFVLSNRDLVEQARAGLAAAQEFLVGKNLIASRTAILPIPEIPAAQKQKVISGLNRIVSLDPNIKQVQKLEDELTSLSKDRLTQYLKQYQRSIREQLDNACKLYLAYAPWLHTIITSSPLMSLLQEHRALANAAQSTLESLRRSISRLLLLGLEPASKYSDIKNAVKAPIPIVPAIAA